MPIQTPRAPIPRSEQLDYWLRRAEQESIAAIRSASPGAAASHSFMARAYSLQASTLLNDQPGAETASVDKWPGLLR